MNIHIRLPTLMSSSVRPDLTVRIESSTDSRKMDIRLTILALLSSYLHAARKVRLRGSAPMSPSTWNSSRRYQNN